MLDLTKVFMKERIAEAVILCPFVFVDELVNPFVFPPATLARRFEEITGYSRREWELREENKRLHRRIIALNREHDRAVLSLLHELEEQDRRHQEEIEELKRRYRDRDREW
jgi:hypothetical protein